MAFGKKTRPRPITTLICGTIFILFGYFTGLHLGKPILDKAKQSANWPTVEGKIETSEVTQERDHINVNRDKKETLYSAKICYSYVVKNKTYESSKIWSGPGYSSSNPAEFYLLVARYPKGEVVAVHYDPEHPDDAVLEAGAFLTSYVLYILGWCLLAIGASLLLSVPWRLFRSFGSG